MTDENQPETPAQDPGNQQPAPEAKVEEVDWKAEARKWEQRAKDNKSAAEKLAQLEESQKSELQKAQERAEAAEKRATEFEHVALRTRIATEMGVIPEVIQGSDEETMRASAQRVLDWANQGKRTPPPAKPLASGSAAAKDGEQGRAAAALRALRKG